MEVANKMIGKAACEDSNDDLGGTRTFWSDNRNDLNF